MIEIKDLWEYAEKRLGKDRVAQIQKEVEFEVRMMRSMQNFIVSAVESFMQENNMKPKDLAAFLHRSPSYIWRLRKGAPNLKIYDLVNIMATLKKDFDVVAVDSLKK